MKALWLPLAACAIAFTLTACGEGKPVVYKQGQYQGKPDTPPWESEPPQSRSVVTWQKGDQASWEQSIRTRNQSQNEYVRAASSTP